MTVTMVTMTVAVGGGAYAALRNPHLNCLPHGNPQGSLTCFVWGVLNKTQIRVYGCQVSATALKSGLFVSKWVAGYKDQKDGENLPLEA